MKQTNNAIKFLMAQYRAIFKNAYFKGIASAVLLTAGLAVAGGAQAADINATSWGSLTTNSDGITIVSGGNADGTSGSYNDFNFNTSGSYSTDAVQNIIIENKSGSNTVTASGAALTVTGTNTTITLQGSGGNAASGALSIAGSGANSATLEVKTFNVGVGELTLSGGNVASGDATLKAGTINLMGGTGSKITLNGTAGSGAAVLQGHLTSSATDTTKLTTLDFTGNGTLKTYGTGVQANITVAAEKDAILDLSLTDTNDETAENQLLQLTGGTFALSGSATASSGASFTIQKGTLEIGDAVVLTATTEATGAGELVVSGSTTADATLRISSEKLKSFLVADKADGSTEDKAGAVTVQSGSIYLTDSTKSAVDLADGFTFGTTATSGTVAFAAATGGVIAGDKLAVSKALTGTATNVNIEATTLTLGSETYDSTTGTGFGFSGATAQSLNLVQDSKVSGSFVLKDAITLKAATQEVDNIYTSDDNTDNVSCGEV